MFLQIHTMNQNAAIKKSGGSFCTDTKAFQDIFNEESKMQLV